MRGGVDLWWEGFGWDESKGRKLGMNLAVASETCYDFKVKSEEVFGTSFGVQENLKRKMIILGLLQNFSIHSSTDEFRSETAWGFYWSYLQELKNNSKDGTWINMGITSESKDRKLGMKSQVSFRLWLESSRIAPCYNYTVSVLPQR